MAINRRTFLQQGTLAGAALLGSRGIADAAIHRQLPDSPLVGICDWTIGGAAEPEIVPKAAELGLEGLQLSVATSPQNVPLRKPDIRQQYLDLASQYDVTYHSVAAGGILNQIPLATEPQSAVYVMDAIEAADELGATNILLAFFGAGDLRMETSTGEYRDLREGRYSRYQLDTVAVQRVVEVLHQVVPRAEEAGVAIGLENTLTARQNMDIIDRVGSAQVQVYYDVGNSWHYGYNVPEEIRMLGNDRICEIHLKDRESRLLGAPEGEVDFEVVASACREIGYDRWYVLETAGRQGHLAEDTRANIAFVEKMFG